MERSLVGIVMPQDAAEVGEMSERLEALWIVKPARKGDRIEAILSRVSLCAFGASPHIADYAPLLADSKTEDWTFYGDKEAAVADAHNRLARANTGKAARQVACCRTVQAVPRDPEKR